MSELMNNGLAFALMGDDDTIQELAEAMQSSRSIVRQLNGRLDDSNAALNEVELRLANLNVAKARLESADTWGGVLRLMKQSGIDADPDAIVSALIDEAVDTISAFVAGVRKVEHLRDAAVKELAAIESTWSVVGTVSHEACVRAEAKLRDADYEKAKVAAGMVDVSIEVVSTPEPAPKPVPKREQRRERKPSPAPNIKDQWTRLLKEKNTLKDTGRNVFVVSCEPDRKVIPARAVLLDLDEWTIMSGYGDGLIVPGRRIDADGLAKIVGIAGVKACSRILRLDKNTMRNLSEPLSVTIADRVAS